MTLTIVLITLIVLVAIGDVLLWLELRRLRRARLTLVGRDPDTPDAPISGRVTHQKLQDKLELDRIRDVVKKRHPNLAPAQQERAAKEIYLRSQSVLGRRGSVDETDRSD